MKKLNIIHEQDFNKDFEYCKNRFPTTHTLLKTVRKYLIEDEERNAQGGIFGIQVAAEWEDKCYCFKLSSSTSDEVSYEYLGLGKT